VKSKLIIIGLMISSLFAVSASGLGQTNLNKITLQDDRSGDHLLFVTSTGEYKFERCSKQPLSGSGVGKVSIDGCTIVLTDFSDSRRVVAEVNLCDKVAKADIAFAQDAITDRDDQPVEIVLSDSNTGNSLFSCDTGAFAK